MPKGIKGFQKGYTPWNKGKKGITNKGSYKKGHIPWSKSQKGIHLSPETEFKKEDVLGRKNVNWNGGKRKMGAYIGVLQKNHPFSTKSGYVREHRLIVEQHIGRYLLPKEQVHHLGAETDNRPHMLMAFSNDKAHKRFERGYKVKSSDIIFDGRNLHKSS